ncbi:MAG TPA: hypothetical protein VMV77_05280 [Bacteroidales bacterium]|nr:hypothetical protein [Bacteroidales bacterium]
MNTEEMLGMLETQCDGFNRYGLNGLLFFLRTAQSVLADTPNEQNIVFDEATGNLLPLETQDGVFKYDAPDDTWRIAGILTLANNGGGLLNEWPGRNSDYGIGRQYSGVKQLEHIYISGIDYIRIPYIRSYDAGDITNPYVIFTKNPGDTEDIYYWYCYGKATALLSESIPLSIKPPYDYMFLFPATVKLAQAYKDGDYLKALPEVMKLKQLYAIEMNKGEQGVDSDAEDRGF